MILSDFLKSELIKEYDNSDEIINSYNKKRYLTLRVNTLKSNISEVKEIFNKNNIKYKNTSFYEEAFIILNKNLNDIIKLEIYKEGKIYLQSLSSMIPPLFLNPKENENILDMTAAPGSKTSEIAALSNNTCLITAIEKDKIRCERLKYNLEKLGVKKVNVLNCDANNLDEFYSFDKILLDAPCSGSGTLTEDNINNFNKLLVEKSVKRQKKLITKAINLLKKDGILVYSTCSILKEENEEIIEEILKTNQVEIINIDTSKYEFPFLKTTIEGTICLYPNEYFEGFFIAILKKL